MLKSPIIQRYITLILYAAVSTMLYQLLASVEVIEKLVSNYSRWIAEQHWLVQGIYFTSLLGLLYMLLVQTKVVPRFRNWSLHKRRFWSYPPLYTSALLSACVFCSLIFPLESVLLFSVLLVALREVLYFVSAKEKSKEKVIDSASISNLEKNPHQRPKTEKELLEWIEKEEPITDESQLWFDRKVYVERIAERLKNAGKAQHVALCGGYGSGKSSVTHLVEKRLKLPPANQHENSERKNESASNAQNTWFTININSWGIEPEAIGSHILRQILNELSQYIDASAFSPLPENYRNALKAKGGWVNVLNEFIGKSSQELASQLTDLDALFKVLNFKMLIVLEDIDRSSRSSELLSALALLVDKLKNLSHFHFIISVGYTKESANIVSRVCDYREDLSQESYIQIFDDFLQLWVRRAKNQGMWVSDLPEEMKLYFSLYPENKSRFSPLASMDKLVHTPRLAKSILRRVNDIWEIGRLMGEIDLIDIVILQTVREVEPDFYTVLKEQSRLDFEDILSTKDGGKENKVATQGYYFLAKEVYGYQREDVNKWPREQLKQKFENELNHILKKYPALAVIDPVIPIFDQYYSTRRMKHKRQRVFDLSYGVRYFNRFEREKLGSDELSDQEFIQELNAYKNNTTETKNRDVPEVFPFIKKLLSDEQYSNRFISPHFEDVIEERIKKQSFYYKLIEDIFKTLKSDTELLVQFSPSVSSDHLSNNLIKLVFDRLILEEEKKVSLYVNWLKYLIRHHFEVLHDWLEYVFRFGRDEKFYPTNRFNKHIIEIQDEIAGFIENSIYEHSLDKKFVKKGYGYLAYSARKQLSWERLNSPLASDEKYIHKTFSQRWGKVILALIKEPQHKEDGIHYLMIAMCFFFNRGEEQPSLDNDYIKYAQEHESLFDKVKEATLRYSRTDYEKAINSEYREMLDVWLNYLKTEKLSTC